MHRSLCLLLSGCAFIDGPPDLSNVEPLLADLRVDPRRDGVVVRFVPPSSLVTGTLTVDLAGTVSTFDIPGGLTSFTPGVGASAVVPHPWTCDGGSVDIDVALETGDGESETFRVPFSLLGGGFFEGEEQISLPSDDVPFIVCGDLPNPEDAFDEVRFRVPEDGLYVIELYWEASPADLDLVLLDDEGIRIVADEAGGSLQPATVQQQLEAEVFVRAQPVHFDGPNTNWQMLVFTQ